MENKRKSGSNNKVVKRKKQHVLTEEDMSNLLQRYTPMTVLTLLREVSEVPYVNIDWNAMVRNTSTGISNPREYQMLWRHMAYRNALIDTQDDTSSSSSQPLDDDSDLECEVEAAPSATSDALSVATAYAKVLMASGASNDPNGSKAQGPLIINVPKGPKLKVPSDSNINNYTQGISISVPVWVLKKPMPSNMNNEVLEANGTGIANRRKVKYWSEFNNHKLYSAVKKHGDGNWAHISEVEFQGHKTALQLSQRWAIMKKTGNSNLANIPQLSEAQLAARHAVSMALDSRPKVNAAQSNLGHRIGIENSRMASQTRSVPPPSPLNPVSTNHLGPSTVPKSRLATEKPSAIKHDIIPDADPKVKAAAIAAGARIATPAADTAQSMPGGTSLRSPITGIGNSLPSNVHFIRTGLATKPLSSGPTVPTTTSQAGGTGTQVPGSSGKTSNPLSQPNVTAVTTSASASSKGKSQFNPGAGN